MSTVEKASHQSRQHKQQRGIRWFAAEFLVVVTGILVALSMDAWWSDRAERVQERELLRGLHAEFVANKALFDHTADLHRQSIAQARQLLELTGSQPSLLR